MLINQIFKGCLENAHISIFRDIPVQVDRLIAELNSSSEYDMTNDWKLLTICIGGNDMCAACEDSV